MSNSLRDDTSKVRTGRGWDFGRITIVDRSEKRTGSKARIHLWSRDFGQNTFADRSEKVCKIVGIKR
eukprot:scaffold187331_cov63-Attheya_sp.AAC.1